MIIGLAGRAGSGKNYVATTHIVPLGFSEIALADEMKVRAVALGVATYDEAFRTKPPHVRKWLQEEGTERGRALFGEDCWCRALAARVRLMQDRWGIHDFVVTDVRFPNEARFLREQLGGFVLKILAPTRVAMSSVTDEQRRHSSEESVDSLDSVDGILRNDVGDAPWVGRHVDAFVTRFSRSEARRVSKS